jgi:hypothetical protein
MANIAKLALKIVVDMEKAQEDFTSMTSTISSIEKSAKSATPSMNNLTDAVKGLGMMQDAVKKSEEVYNNEPLLETKRLVDQTTAAYGSMRDTVQKLGQGVSDDILNMKPTIANVQKAETEIKKLLALQKEMGANGYLLDGAIQKAQSSMMELGNKTMQTQMEA